MRAWMMAALVAATSWGCANVRLTQRDGCWVRQTERFPKTLREEIGPCSRAEPQWSDDRVTRLVQECLAEADYRWQTEALAAWSKGQPLPPQRSEQSIMDACMSHAATALVAENEALKKRIAELSLERETLRSMAQEEREHLRASGDRLAEALGEAAKKPAPAAIATANSTGTASTQSEQTAQPGAPSSTSITLPAAPAPVPLAAPLKKPHPEKRRSPPPSCAPGAKSGSVRTGDGALCAPLGPPAL